MLIVKQHAHMKGALTGCTQDCSLQVRIGKLERVAGTLGRAAEVVANVVCEGTPHPSSAQVGLRETFGADLRRMIMRPFAHPKHIDRFPRT